MVLARSSGWTSANADVPTSASGVRPAISAKRALTRVMRPSRSMWATPAAAWVTMVRNSASDSRSASLTRRRSLMSTKVSTTPEMRSSPLRYGRKRASSQPSPKRTSRSIGIRLSSTAEASVLSCG